MNYLGSVLRNKVLESLKNNPAKLQQQKQKLLKEKQKRQQRHLEVTPSTGTTTETEDEQFLSPSSSSAAGGGREAANDLQKKEATAPDDDLTENKVLAYIEDDLIFDQFLIHELIANSDSDVDDEEMNKTKPIAKVQKQQPPCRLKLWNCRSDHENNKLYEDEIIVEKEPNRCKACCENELSE